jgi:predicted kinase
MRQNLADFVKKELPDKTVLITCGFPASGKTVSARIIAEIKGYHVLRSDLVRLEVLKGEDVFDEKVASSMNKRILVYDEIFKRADELAAMGLGIILDATFITRALRLRAASIADKNNLPFVIQQNKCSKDVCLRRISQRSKDNYQSNAISEQAYLNNVTRFEDIDLDVLKKSYPNLDIIHFVVDSSSDIPEKWCVIKRNAR